MLADGESIASAAREVGICYSTAMKYKKAGMLPSELKSLQTETRPRLFEDRWERDVGPYLAKQANISARAILTDLIKKKPNQYNQSMLRTFQRRIKEWKVQNHEKVYEHHIFGHLPGEVCIFQFIPLPRNVRLRGEAVPGTLFLFYLPHSQWIYLAPMRQRRWINILECVEDAIWTLGFVPKVHINNVRPRWIQPDPPFRPRRPKMYNDFCLHYNFRMGERIPYPLAEGEVKTKIRNAFKEKYKDKQKLISFQTFDQFKNSIISISEDLNSTIKDKELTAERDGSRELPEKGIVMSLDSFRRVQKL